MSDMKHGPSAESEHGPSSPGRQYPASTPADWDGGVAPPDEWKALDQLGGRAAGASVSNVFVTGVDSNGSVSGITYESNTVPANKVVESFDSDNDTIRVTVEIHVEGDAYQPASVRGKAPGGAWVTILKQNWTQKVTNARVYEAEIEMADGDEDGNILIEVSDGATTDVAYDRLENPPDVLSITVEDQGTNPDPYPGIQTELANGQTFKITVTTDAHADEVYIKDFEATSGQSLQGPYAVAGGTTGEITITAGNASAVNQRIKAYAKTTAGSPGADFISSAPQDVDCDQTTPNLVLSGIVYPVSQAALSDDENAQITITDSARDAGDSTLWDEYGATADFTDTGNPAVANSEAEVDAATYDTTSWNGGIKWVERQATNYRDSSYNLKVTAVRLAKNGLSQTLNILVKIAHTAPTIDITNNGEGSPAVFRSKTGGDKTYTITITSDQELEVAPTLSRDAADDGDALGAFSGGPKVWTATITIGEEDTKNVAGAIHDFYSLVARNNADKTQNTINSGSAYRVAGFEQRDVAVLKFDTFEPIGTMVSNRDNPTKLDMEYVGIGDGVYVANTTNDPGSLKFTIVDISGTFDADGNYIKCNDSNIYDAIDYTMRIEELA